MVVAAQDLASQTPAASGVVLGLAGALHVGLGKLQEAIGLVEGMIVALAMAIPAVAIVLVLLRHPRASGRPSGDRPRRCDRGSP